MNILNEYRFKADGARLSLQPNRIYRYKIIGCAVLALLAWGIALSGIGGQGLRILLIAIGVIGAGYALYDALFRIGLTYIFDKQQQLVFRKFPGLWTHRLMAFEDIYILPETEHGSLRYVLSRKQHKYGKGYPVSDFFPDNTKGRARQEQFESEILAALILFVEKDTAPANQ